MYGFKITVADDGLEGLMKLESMRPDLIIIDMMMPRLDGMTFVKAIKGRGETKSIRLHRPPSVAGAATRSASRKGARGWCRRVVLRMQTEQRMVRGRQDVGFFLPPERR